MLVRAAIVLAVVLAALALHRLWRRPPARLRRLDLTGLGIGGPAVVQFSTPYCAPCKRATPILEEAAREAEVPYAQVDLEEHPEAAWSYGIRSVPTIVVTGPGGRVRSVWTGLPSDGEVAEAARRARMDA